MNQTLSSELVNFFARAKIQRPELYRQWVTIATRVGMRLPTSLLSYSIQREGEFDVLLRGLEAENGQRIAENREPGLFDGHYLYILTTYWIGGMYETFRLLKDRKLTGNSELFEPVFRDLELLRMPLEKHEIAKDRNIKEPLRMMRAPRNHDATDEYVYDSKDSARSYIMPAATSQRGSMMWQAIDLKANSARWIERLDLSERIIELWKDQ